jgi:transposase
MSDIEGYCRPQRLLWPDLLDDDVTAEHPVRVIDASGERLDLERLGFARAQAALTGRPAYAPRDVLRLYSYGDLNRIRSSRSLERETHRHVERIWRLRTLRPDVKTIADFRKNTPKALPALCREVVLWCKPLALFGTELLASDGSQFKAVNSHHKTFTKTKLEQALQDLDEQVAQYLSALEASEREASSVHQPTSEELPKTIERLQERQQRYYGGMQEMTASGETPRSLTDPESRSLPKSPKVDVGDNGQVAVDSQPKLMVEPDVTHAVTDDEQLSPLAMRAKETLGVERLRAVADRGYDPGHESNACDEAGLDADVPTPSTSANTTLGRCGKGRVSDDPHKDCYRWPGGAERTFRCETTELGRPSRSSATAAGRKCPLKEPCTSNTDGRRLTRGVDEHILERMEERLNATPASMQERKPLVEHPFGTITHANDQGYFLMKGLKNVRAECSLSCVADNRKRVLNILGVPRLLVALG